jgi:hypothetical protein
MTMDVIRDHLVKTDQMDVFPLGDPALFAEMYADKPEVLRKDLIRVLRQMRPSVLRKGRSQ